MDTEKDCPHFTAEGGMCDFCLEDYWNERWCPDCEWFHEEYKKCSRPLVAQGVASLQGVQGIWGVQGVQGVVYYPYPPYGEIEGTKGATGATGPTGWTGV